MGIRPIGIGARVANFTRRLPGVIPVVVSLAAHAPLVFGPHYCSLKPHVDLVAPVPSGSAPVEEKNEISVRERTYFQSELNKMLDEGKGYIDQYLREGKSNLDPGKYFMKTEWLAQRLESKVYLMPEAGIELLLNDFETDVQKFGSIVKDKTIDREDKFKELDKLVYGKSGYDPGATLLPSLMSPEGGQQCQIRTKYKLALLSRFPELLLPGERLVVGIFSGHHDIGIYNSQEKTVIMFDSSKHPTKEWTADLYGYHVLVRSLIDYYRPSGSKYEEFVVAKANKEGPHGTIEIEGPVSSLSFDPKIKATNSSHEGVLRLRRESGSQNGLSEIEQANLAINELKSVSSLLRRKSKAEVAKIIINDLYLLSWIFPNKTSERLSLSEYGIVLDVLLTKEGTEAIVKNEQTIQNAPSFFDIVIEAIEVKIFETNRSAGTPAEILKYSILDRMLKIDRIYLENKNNETEADKQKKEIVPPVQTSEFGTYEIDLVRMDDNQQDAKPRLTSLNVDKEFFKYMLFETRHDVYVTISLFMRLTKEDAMWLKGVEIRHVESGRPNYGTRSSSPPFFTNARVFGFPDLIRADLNRIIQKKDGVEREVMLLKIYAMYSDDLLNAGMKYENGSWVAPDNNKKFIPYKDLDSRDPLLKEAREVYLKLVGLPK